MLARTCGNGEVVSFLFFLTSGQVIATIVTVVISGFLHVEMNRSGAYAHSPLTLFLSAGAGTVREVPTPAAASRGASPPDGLQTCRAGSHWRCRCP